MLHRITGDQPLPYLAAQAACAGIAVALLYALGNAAFILSGGAQRIAYAYLWVSVTIPPLSFIYNRLQRERSVATLARITVVLFSAVSMLAWLLSLSTRLDLAAYVLFAGYALALAFLAIAVVTQANRLLSPEQLVVQFPQILAVQTVGLIFCGLLVAPISRWLGGTNQSLMIAALVMLAMWVIIELTIYRFPTLKLLEKEPSIRPLKLEKLLRLPLPRWLVVYQLLSSGVTLLIMYMVPIMAQEVYRDGDSLTQFFGYLIAGATFGALLFLLFGASRLLLRFGLGAGLLINPIGVCIVIFFMLLASWFFPQQIVLLLGFAATARGIDFILSIGATETAINAVIKGLDEPTQLPLLNAINALAVPLSYGAAGLVIVATQWLDTEFSTLVSITLGCSLIWTITAVKVIALNKSL